MEQLDPRRVVTWLRGLVQPAPLLSPPPPEPRQLGLALGGGGGKAAAHLGILRVIAELGLPIDRVVGTSAGAAVAILYAAGLSLEQIAQVFRDTSLRRIASTDPSRTGLIGSRRREEVVRAALGTRTFADLAIPCAVVATDLVSGQPVVINEGSLVEALLATTAVPGIFPPVFRGDQILVDGGVVNNVPVDIAYSLGATRVIAVSLEDDQSAFSLDLPPESNPLARLTLAPQQFAVANRALALLSARATALQLAQYPPDLLLRPAVGAIALLDMSATEQAIPLGEQVAREAINDLIALRAWRLSPPSAAPSPMAAAQPAKPRLTPVQNERA